MSENTNNNIDDNNHNKVELGSTEHYSPPTSPIQNQPYQETSQQTTATTTATTTTTSNQPYTEDVIQQNNIRFVQHTFGPPLTIPQEALDLLQDCDQYQPQPGTIDGDLFIDMAKIVGEANITRPPSFLTDDYDKKAWLKRGPNAMLYFIYKTPKYKRQVKEILDQNLRCVYLCPKAVKCFEHNHSWCCIPCAWIFCLPCYDLCGSCCCYTGRDVKFDVYRQSDFCYRCTPTNQPIKYLPILFSATEGQYFPRTGSSAIPNQSWREFTPIMRNHLIERLHHAGFNYKDDWAKNCCTRGCCWLSYITKYFSVVWFITSKRYGQPIQRFGNCSKLYNQLGLSAERPMNPIWVQFMSYMSQKDSGTPYQPLSQGYYYNDTATTRDALHFNRSETTYQTSIEQPMLQIPFLSEWSGDLKQAVELHQHLWGSIKMIDINLIQIPLPQETQSKLSPISTGLRME